MHKACMKSIRPFLL